MTEIITIEGSRLTSDNDGDVIIEDDDRCVIIKNEEIPGIIAFLLSVEVKA